VLAVAVVVVQTTFQVLLLELVVLVVVETVED
jgi:hypothetical protein